MVHHVQNNVLEWMTLYWFELINFQIFFFFFCKCKYLYRRTFQVSVLYITSCQTLSSLCLQMAWHQSALGHQQATMLMINSDIFPYLLIPVIQCHLCWHDSIPNARQDLSKLCGTSEISIVISIVKVWWICLMLSDNVWTLQCSLKCMVATSKVSQDSTDWACF